MNVHSENTHVRTIQYCRHNTVKMMSTEQHVDASKSKNNTIIKTIRSDVFVALKQLTNDTKTVRVKGAFDLVQQLQKKSNSNDENTVDKNRTYSLQRLVRGLGASTSSSRAGFYTALVGILSHSAANEYPSIGQLIEIMQKELSVSKTGCNSKEDSDALVGQILVCAAILHAKRTMNSTEIVALVQILIGASHHKSFHSALAYKFLHELLIALDATDFTESVWPLMRKELKRPWEKQNINTLQFLIEVQLKYPQIVDEDFLNASLKSNEILSPGAYKHIGRLLWAPASAMIAATHPAYESFAKLLATGVPTKVLLRFWKSEVNETLLATNKLKEIATLRILTGIFTHRSITIETATELLSNVCIKMLVTSMKNSKQKKHEFIVRFHTEFFEALETFLDSFAGNDSAIIGIIKRFICHPGTLLIEKYAPDRFVHRLTSKLSAAGIRELYDIYKNVLIEKTVKNPKDANDTWLHIEKQHCIHQMQTLLGMKIVHAETAWRIEQLKLLLKLSLFYVDQSGESITTKDKDSGIVTKELAQHIKQAFYVGLHTKGQSLAENKTILLAIAEYCNETLAIKALNKMLRKPLTDKALPAWRRMYGRVSTMAGQKSNLNTVFTVLLLQMGLQLFQEPQMAQESIDDLIKCIERTHSKRKGNTEEPEWIEVIVDLFLHFLSQNMSFLRTIVANVFPQLCDNLNLTAMNQILSMLDMKEANPLSTTNGQLDEEEEDDKEGDTESDDDNDDEEMEEEKEDDEDQSSEDDEDDDDDDDDDEIGDENDEGTATEHLRSILSSTLGQKGTESDVESLDLNDMDDAEGERLDAALADAFKSLGKRSGANGVGSKKKTKRERTINTTVMHFRIRVLDLIEIYLKTNPSLMMSLEILLVLVAVAEHCRTNKEMAPLSNRVNHVLRTLLTLRHFANTDDVTETNLVDVLNTLITAISHTVDEPNSLLSRCMVFLIGCSQTLPVRKSKAKQHALRDAFRNSLETFMNSRNAPVSINCFRAIVSLRWCDVWHLGQTLVDCSLLAKEKSRVFRRTQALILLRLIFKNHGFIKLHADEFATFGRSMEAGLVNYTKWLCTNAQISCKELDALLTLYTEIHKCAQLYKSSIDWKAIGECVQRAHKTATFCTHSIYVKLCNLLSLTPQPKLKDVGFAGAAEQTKTQNGPQKRKAPPADATTNGGKVTQNSNKMKKLKKQERMKLASQGLENVTFHTATATTNGTSDAAMDTSSDSESD